LSNVYKKTTTTDGKCGQVFGVFDQQEVAQLLMLLSRLPDRKTTVNAYTNGFTRDDIAYQLINKLVCSRLEKILQTQIDVHVGMFLKEDVPWYIHTDYIKGDDDPGQAILVPLEILPSFEHATHTLIFNEECKTTFTDFVNTTHPVENNAGNIFDEHYSHGNIKELEHVSVKMICRWEPGSIIYWDRTLLHASDNFLKNGVTEKRALVLFASNTKGKTT